jgi:hypothetical protein
MRKPIPPIIINRDFKPQSLETQKETLARLLHEVDLDQNRGRLHPQVAALRRWDLKSIFYTLSKLPAPDAASEPSTPSNKEAA